MQSNRIDYSGVKNDKIKVRLICHYCFPSIFLGAGSVVGVIASIFSSAISLPFSPNISSCFISRTCFSERKKFLSTKNAIP